MNNLCVDLGWRSINKYGEQLCGDRVQIVSRLPIRWSWSWLTDWAAG